MKAFIYTGGKIHPDFIHESPKEGDLKIAADSGYGNALLLNQKVDTVIGDFDSIGEIAKDIPDSTKKIQVPAEKDESDTHLAIKEALEQGVCDIVIIGGLSGRLDHTLSSIYILETLDENGIHAIMTDGQNRIRFIKSTSLLIAKTDYKYISLICADSTVKGVSIEGCKYPLKNARLSRKFQYAISNEITENCALISVRKGGVFIIESRDILN